MQQGSQDSCATFAGAMDLAFFYHPLQNSSDPCIKTYSGRFEQQADAELTKMAWEGSGCGRRSCVLMSASWRARNLARPDTC